MAIAFAPGGDHDAMPIIRHARMAIEYRGR
jgi:hypothetical protein